MPKKFHPHDYKIIITKLRDGKQQGLEFYIPAFNAIVFGDTADEALEGYLGYFDDEVKRRKEKGIPMPKPDNIPDKIRQIPLRVPQRVYQRISETAKKKNQSFNAFVNTMLEEACEA